MWVECVVDTPLASLHHTLQYEMTSCISTPLMDADDTLDDIAAQHDGYEWLLHEGSPPPCYDHCYPVPVVEERLNVMNYIAHVTLKKGNRHATTVAPVDNLSNSEPLIIRKGQEVVSLLELDNEEELEIDLEEWAHSIMEGPSEAPETVAGLLAGAMGNSPGARDIGQKDRQMMVALISDILKEEEHEDRDEDGIPVGDPRYKKSGRDIIDSVDVESDEFKKWCEVWVCQMKFGPEATLEKKEDIKRLLYAFRDTIAENPRSPKPIKGIEHIIKMEEDWDGKPRRVRLRPHSPKEFEAVRAASQELLDEGLVRASDSPWSCGLVLVPKSDGSLRPCCDFRRLNDCSVADAMPIPRVDDMLDKLRDATEFSAIDMAAGYFACNLREEDRQKTAFRTWSHGLLEWTRMPMGLKGAGASYQRMLQMVLGPLLWESAFNYLDDVSIISKGTEHVNDLARVLKRLSRWDITMKLPKCMFSTRTLPFLGFVVHAEDGISVDRSKVEAIVKLKAPTDVTGVKSVLGSCSFLRKFIPDYASLTAPLRELIKGKKKKESIVQGWQDDPRCEAAFTALKAALTSSPVLAFPDFARKFYIAADASKYQIGACLFQYGPDDDEEGDPEKKVPRPIAYASRTLSSAEEGYHITDKECLSVIYACRQFRKYIHQGGDNETVVITDHAALTSVMHKPDLTGRLLRFALELGELPLSIHHRPGATHHMPDLLSRFGVDDLSAHELADEVDKLLKNRFTALIESARIEDGVESYDPAVIEELMSERNREMRLQLLAKGSSPSDDAETTMSDLRSRFREQLQETQARCQNPADESGEYCHIAEVMERVIPIRNACVPSLQERLEQIVEQYPRTDSPHRTHGADGEVLWELVCAVTRAATKKSSTPVSSSSKDDLITPNHVKVLHPDGKKSKV